MQVEKVKRESWIRKRNKRKREKIEKVEWKNRKRKPSKKVELEMKNVTVEDQIK